MTESSVPAAPELADVRALKTETRAEFRAQFEEEAREHIEKGEVWIYGSWFSKDTADRVKRQLVRRARLIHLETMAGLVVLLLVALITWVLVCLILTPYPPNPRAGLLVAPEQTF